MPPSVQEFRHAYRAQISPRYRGEWHAAAVAGFGAIILVTAVIGWGAPSLAELPIVLANLVIANFGIYAIHRGLGHHRRPLASAFYERHTKQHHNFFSPQHIAWERGPDLRVVLFPLPLLFVVAAAAGGVGMGVARLFDPRAASAVFCTTVGYYLAYEFIHFCDHLPEDHLLTRVPGLRYMRAHHRAHHNPRAMHRMNFNIVFPLADWVVGTLIARDAMSFDKPPPSSQAAPTKGANRADSTTDNGID